VHVALQVHIFSSLMGHKTFTPTASQINSDTHTSGLLQQRDGRILCPWQSRRRQIVKPGSWRRVTGRKTFLEGGGEDDSGVAAPFGYFPRRFLRVLERFLQSPVTKTPTPPTSLTSLL
jgi:hypothetical protein